MIVKATSPPQTGLVSLRLSAFSGRTVEICSNGIDDDGNGLIDCADPDLLRRRHLHGAGLHARPERRARSRRVDAGSVDDPDLTVDTTNGKDLYQTECGRGNGKEQVVRLTLTQPMALGLDCTRDRLARVRAVARS